MSCSFKRTYKFGRARTYTQVCFKLLQIVTGRPWIVISNGAQVRGLTTILDRLYVARSRCPDIEVYESQTYALLRTLKVTDCDPCDMTSDMSSKLIIRFVFLFKIYEHKIMCMLFGIVSKF